MSPAKQELDDVEADSDGASEGASAHEQSEDDPLAEGSPDQEAGRRADHHGREDDEREPDAAEAGRWGAGAQPRGSAIA